MLYSNVHEDKGGKCVTIENPKLKTLKKLPKASTDYEKQRRIITLKRECKYVSFLRMRASSSSRKEEEFEEKSCSLPKTSTKKSSFAEQRESECVPS